MSIPISKDPASHAFEATNGSTKHKSKPTPVTTIHPMDCLTGEEIKAICIAIKKHVVEHQDIHVVKFITCAVMYPLKRDVLAYLGIPLQTGQEPEPWHQGMMLDRRATVDFIDCTKGDAFNVVVTLADQNVWNVDKVIPLAEGVQPPISVFELAGAEEIIRKNPRVQELAAEIGLKPENLYADGWSIGWDSRFPKHKRLQQAILYARFDKDDNLYAHPLDFTPVLDSNTFEVIHIDFPPHRVPTSSSPEKTTGIPPLTSQSTAPPPLGQDSLTASGRKRIPYPDIPHEYLPDFIEKYGNKKPSTRKPLKPLHIVQPDGVSFEMNGNEIEWQQWKMHVAFSQREGIVLSTIRYDDNGVVRPLIYRMSLCEMIVPYGVPEHPHPRKFAFDVGEYGVGTLANDLSLGCDCLGKIHYLPGQFVGHDGEIFNIEKAICIHEEDHGLLWKHRDYRLDGRVRTVRSRRLVISMVCTLANYEYLFYYYFYLDGSIEFEVQLTGILSVSLFAPSDPIPNPFATQVAPGIAGQYHQHLFCVRIDPMIDGLKNSVLESDIIPLPSTDTGSKDNYAGNAFIVQENIIKTEKEGGRDYDHAKERRWSIINPFRKHYASKKNTSYVLGFRGHTSTLMAKPKSWARQRAAFASKSLWVVKEASDGVEGRMWPAGRYVPQSNGTPEDSLSNWAKGDESVEEQDIVIFATLGTTHIPRPEDWPVMPVESVKLTLKPVHFFDANPALDVQDANDSLSTLAFEANGQPTENTCCDQPHTKMVGLNSMPFILSKL